MAVLPVLPVCYKFKSSTSTYTMSPVLKVKWTPRLLYLSNPAKSLMIQNPQELMAYILKQELANVVPKPAMKIEDYWVWIHDIMVVFINGQPARVQTRASTLQDKHQIQLAYLRQATTFLFQATMDLEFSLKTTIGSLTIPSQKPEEL